MLQWPCGGTRTFLRRLQTAATVIHGALQRGAHAALMCSHRIPESEGTLETILARDLHYVWGSSVFPKCNSGIAKESGGISLKQ